MLGSCVLFCMRAMTVMGLMTLLWMIMNIKKYLGGGRDLSPCKSFSNSSQCQNVSPFTSLHCCILDIERRRHYLPSIIHYTSIVTPEICSLNGSYTKLGPCTRACRNALTNITHCIYLDFYHEISRTLKCRGDNLCLFCISIHRLQPWFIGHRIFAASDLYIRQCREDTVYVFTASINK